MLWLLAAGWLLTVLVCWTFHLLLVRELTAQHRHREATWELKEERLLNRCMTKDWQSYVQMGATMGASSPFEIPGEGIGQSDESEGLAWAKAHGSPELGDILLEQDLGELGILQ
jgi:hypothetical protein